MFNSFSVEYIVDVSTSGHVFLLLESHGRKWLIDFRAKFCAVCFVHFTREENGVHRRRGSAQISDVAKFDR